MKVKSFNTALTFAGMTYKDFAARHKVSEEFILYVVKGKIKSNRMEQAIDDFIHEQFRVAISLSRKSRTS